MALTPSIARAEILPLFIGTYSQDATHGINLAHFDSQSGALKIHSIAAKTSNPTFLALHPNGKFLYAVNESGEVAGKNIGGLSAFEIDAQTQSLHSINSVAAGGGLCHLTIDATGKFLLAAAYGSGSFEVWKLKPNGEIGERVQFIQNAAEAREDGKVKKPHGHQIVLSADNRFAYGVDLGLDKVFIYRLNAETGVLAPHAPPFVAVKDKTGPRHLTFDTDGKTAYLINEYANTVIAMKHENGTLEAIQETSTLPAEFVGENYTAEVAIHPNGKFLYGSNRRHDSIAIFDVAADGTLQARGTVPTQGRNPRHFTISPDGKFLLAANQTDRSITVFRIDQITGKISISSVLRDVPGEPVCLLFPATSSVVTRDAFSGANSRGAQ